MIVIATAAIIATATTTSLSAATPAFAKRNCDVTDGIEICSGGSGCGRNGCMGGTSPSDSPGGGGGRSGGGSLTGGGGFNSDTEHGGFGIGIGGGSGLNGVHPE